MKQIKVDGDAAIKILEGNWWKFPPPTAGVYDVRQPGSVFRSYTLYERVPVTDHPKGKGLVCLGTICHTSGKLAGYEFRFPVGHSPGGWPVQTCFVPYRITYSRTPVGLVKAGQERIVGTIPIARSIEEARYIVSRLTELWPQYNGLHIEFQEEAV